MYLRKGKIAAMNHTVALCMIITVAVIVGWMLKPVDIHERLENIAQVEYYRNYSVERYNGKVDRVALDWHTYDIDAILPQENSEISACDDIDESNEEGQTCILTDTIKIWEFLNHIGY